MASSAKENFSKAHLDRVLISDEATQAVALIFDTFALKLREGIDPREVADLLADGAKELRAALHERAKQLSA